MEKTTIMKLILATLTLVALLTASPAQAAPPVAPTIKRQLAPKNGWLPDPAKFGFRLVSPRKLSAVLRTKVRTADRIYDHVIVYQRQVGRQKFFVLDSAFEGMTTRDVLNARGKPL